MPRSSPFTAGPGSRPDVADQDRTKSTYALQWNRYRIIRPDEDRATFRNHTGLEAGDRSGGVVLDAGCGMGRYLRVAAESPASLVVGLDLSLAVTSAAETTAGHPRVAVVQGDLLRPPFPVGAFDHVYSLGVLDHTPDPRCAFHALAPLLKPGGRIVVWVYPREHRAVEMVMNAQRAVSTRLPLAILEPLCRLLAPVGALKRRMTQSPSRLIERLGVALHVATIGVSMHPDAEVRICDTLDWYAPRYLTRHTAEEVMGWFREAGLVEIIDLGRDPAFFHQGQGRGVNIAGRRPRESSPATLAEKTQGNV